MKLLRENIGYKLLALAVAVIIWLYANEPQRSADVRNSATSRITREVFDIPLEVRKLEPGCTVTTVPKSVKLVVHGPAERVRTIVMDPDIISAYINIRGKTSGQYKLPIKVSMPQNFSATTTCDVVPDMVLVTVEGNAERAMQIDTQFAGNLPSNFRMGIPEVLPREAVVHGTMRSIDKVSRLVVFVDASGGSIIDGVYPVVALNKAGKQLSDLDITPGTVRVKCDLLQAPASRAVYLIPNVTGQPTFPYKVSAIGVHPQTLTVTGRPEVLAKLNTIETDPVRIEDHKKTFTQRVKIIAPEGTSISDTKYATVTIMITPVDKPGEPTGNGTGEVNTGGSN